MKKKLFKKIVSYLPSFLGAIDYSQTSFAPKSSTKLCRILYENLVPQSHNSTNFLHKVYANECADVTSRDDTKAPFENVTNHIPNHRFHTLDET